MYYEQPIPTKMAQPKQVVHPTKPEISNSGSYHINGRSSKAEPLWGEQTLRTIGGCMTRKTLNEISFDIDLQNRKARAKLQSETGRPIMLLIVGVLAIFFVAIWKHGPTEINQPPQATAERIK